MDRRLSVNKSSAKISKTSRPSPPRGFFSTPSAGNSRPPATIVNADPSSFRRVVQELTGTPPPSASSSPARISDSAIARPSRLQRFAPPPLRQTLAHPQQAATQHPLQQYQEQQEYQFHLPQQQAPSQFLHQRHPQYAVQDSIQKQHGAISPSFATLFPSPQFVNPNPNPNSSFLPMLSPHFLSPLPVLTPGDNTWANPLDVIPSPASRPMFNGTNPLPPLLPLPSPRSGQELVRPCSGHGREELPSSLPSSHVGHPPRPHLPSGAASWQYSQSPYPPLLPSPMAPSLPGFSLLPWSPLASPPPFSPSLFLQSPGVGRPTGRGFSFQGPNDHSSKPS